jgi:putative membrane protein
MKNSILSLLAVAAIVACKKSDTTTMNTTGDSTSVMTNDSAMMDNDSTMMPADSVATVADNNRTVNLSAQDKKFADAAARGGMMEVMMGQLASTNADNPTVKSLGAMMVKDHSKANDWLKQWASTAGYTLPTSLAADQQKKYDDLKAKKGADFDRAYADLMISDHIKDIAEFKEEASKGTESSLKSFANKTVPTLEHHLMESEKAKAAVK